MWSDNKNTKAIMTNNPIQRIIHHYSWLQACVLFRQQFLTLEQQKEGFQNNQFKYLLGLQNIYKIFKGMTFNKRNSHSIFVTFILCMCIASYECLDFSNQNYLATKNNKIFAFSLNNSLESDINSLEINRIWISNSQQFIKIQTPINSEKSAEKYPISNFTRDFPIFYTNLVNKGYVRPFDPFHDNSQSNFMLRGYRYIKSPSQDERTDETIVQIQHFLQALIKQNNMQFLNLRMEDSFLIEVIQHNAQNSASQIASIRVKYLFPTVQKSMIPANILQKISRNVYTHEQYLNLEKKGSIERKISGKGLHQWANTTFILNDQVDILIDPYKSKCFVQFTDILPESTYVDVDQRRTQTKNYETINIEKPAFASKQYFYKFRLPFSALKQTGVHKYTYQQPIHFRYPAPSNLSITRVYLHPIQKGRVICDENSGNEQNNFKVYQLKENNLFQRGTAKIPNADSSMTKVVSVGTLIVCLVAILIITNALKKK